MRPTGILVAVPGRLYRDALAAALGREVAIEIVGRCACLDEVMRGVCELRPDVLLFDPALPGEGSLIQTFSPEWAGLGLIVLGEPCAAAARLAGAHAGVSACVSCDDCFADLVRTVRRVAAHASTSSPMIGASRVGAERRDTREARLTAREFEIVELIDEGLSNKEIARELSIELATVKNHVHHVLEKLGVSRRGQAAARLRRAGVLH